ncbi:MAG: radical SAM protein, partial [Polyangiaceae bacterium]|nr:radical SAM protein [Polyangiaceae bacterium]
MLTRYHVAVPDFDGAGSTLLRSTVTGVAALVSPAMHRALEEGVEDLTCLPAETARVLAEHFIVPDREIDAARMLERIRTTAAQRRLVSVTLMTTGACNMACRYCFQNDLLPDHKHFKPELVEPFVGWVVRTVAERGARALMMHFYGGEPLLNFPVIEEVATRLRTESIRRRVQWHMTLTTNGSLMTRKAADRLAQMGCSLAIISLDGPPEVQDHRRPLKVHQQSSFERVLGGIKSALRRFDVLLRTNIDHQNKDQLAELVRLLEAEGLLHHPRLFHSLEAVGPVLHPTEHVSRHVMSIAESGDVLARG